MLQEKLSRKGDGRKPTQKFDNDIQKYKYIFFINLFNALTYVCICMVVNRYALV